MANKVLLAYVAADALFVVMGAIMLGFTIIVQNEMSLPIVEGQQVARNLLYSRFPLQGRQRPRNRRGRWKKWRTARSC